MNPNYLFGTQAQARKFRSEMRKRFILTREITPCFIEIAYFDDIRPELQESTRRIADRAYKAINPFNAPAV